MKILVTTAILSWIILFGIILSFNEMVFNSYKSEIELKKFYEVKLDKYKLSKPVQECNDIEQPSDMIFIYKLDKNQKEIFHKNLCFNISMLKEKTIKSFIAKLSTDESNELDKLFKKVIRSSKESLFNKLLP